METSDRIESARPVEQEAEIAAGEQSSKLTLTCLSSEGCGLPGRQVPMARLIREAVITALWPRVADDAVAIHALVLVCNVHPEASWWIVHQYEVKDLTENTMERWLALRKRVDERQMSSASPL